MKSLLIKKLHHCRAHVLRRRIRRTTPNALKPCEGRMQCITLTTTALNKRGFPCRSRVPQPCSRPQPLSMGPVRTTMTWRELRCRALMRLLIKLASTNINFAVCIFLCSKVDKTYMMYRHIACIPPQIPRNKYQCTHKHIENDRFGMNWSRTARPSSTRRHAG